MPDTPPAGGTVEERLAAVESLTRDLASALARFQRDTPPPVWSWLATTDPDMARDILADLVPWVHAVWLAWPDAHLPGCWLRHPDVVEELWALRNAWRAHELRGGTWTQRVDWLERVRPAAARRLSALGGSHNPDRGDSCLPDPANRPAYPSDDDLTGLAEQHCTQQPPPA